MKKLIEAQLFKKEFNEAESFINYDMIFQNGDVELEVGNFLVGANGEIAYNITLDVDYEIQQDAIKFLALNLKKVTGKRVTDEEIIKYADLYFSEDGKIDNVCWKNALNMLLKADRILEERVIDDELVYSSEEEDDIIPDYGNPSYKIR